MYIYVLIYVYIYIYIHTNIYAIDIPSQCWSPSPSSSWERRVYNPWPTSTAISRWYRRRRAHIYIYIYVSIYLYAIDIPSRCWSPPPPSSHETRVHNPWPTSTAISRRRRSELCRSPFRWKRPPCRSTIRFLSVRRRPHAGWAPARVQTWPCATADVQRGLGFAPRCVSKTPRI